ncbi:MAG: ATP-binding protein [Methanobacteriaceae archaeon]
MALIEKISPFQPEEPVHPENFEGRKEIIEKYMPYINESAKGRARHFFVTGTRGMGKTSLASYFSDIAERKCKMISVHILNDGVHSIESLIQQIIERLLNEIEKESWFDKIADKFLDNIETVGLWGTQIKFNPEQKTIKHIKDNFPFILADIVNQFDDKNGLFITIDDINGLSDSPDFANWYKSFADTLSTHFKEGVPITMMLLGYPEKLESLYNHNPSFNRIFKHIEIEGLDDKEVEDFFTKTFKKVNISVEEDAMNLMVHFSSTLPTMMQEIGDGVFWINEDDSIDYNDAIMGIIRAGNEIGIKYLKPALDRSIRSSKYLDIFDKLGENFLNQELRKDYSFEKKDFISKLNDNEANVFSDFLRRARDLNIIEFKGAKRSGHYKFTNNLYPIYFLIQALDKSNLE